MCFFQKILDKQRCYLNDNVENDPIPAGNIVQNGAFFFETIVRFDAYLLTFSLISAILSVLGGDLHAEEKNVSLFAGLEIT